MESSDLRREENYSEYLRLIQNNDYVEVTFDEESGGVSAVHRSHKFDKQKGAQSQKRGDYERAVLEVVRELGHRIVLEAETNIPGVKSFDGYLDDIPMEIKAVEGMGAWSISTKLRYAEKQRAQCVVLYFPDKTTYSEERIMDGIGKYSATPNLEIELNIKRLIAISNGEMLGVWDKKATPIKGWSNWEGFRRENGAHSYTLSPSDAKI